MYFNNRNNRNSWGFGCSILSLFLGLMIISMLIRGSLIFFFRYFWLIVALAIVVWVFRKIIRRNKKDTPPNNHQGQRRNWQRDFENRNDTSYHNIDRDFEEVDENDDEFDDF